MGARHRRQIRVNWLSRKRAPDGRTRLRIRFSRRRKDFTRQLSEAIVPGTLSSANESDASSNRV
jgi:hypothetical protein